MTRQVQFRHILPQGGFYYKQLLLTNRQQTNIVLAMQSDHSVRLTRADAQTRFTQLFEEAIKQIANCGTMEPEKFWASVGANVRWIRNKERSSRPIDGETLLRLTRDIISARVFPTVNLAWMDQSCVSFVSLTDPRIGEFTMPPPFARKVDSFRRGVFKMYGASSEVSRKYIPATYLIARKHGNGPDKMDVDQIIDKAVEETCAGIEKVALNSEGPSKSSETTKSEMDKVVEDTRAEVEKMVCSDPYLVMSIPRHP